jgi:hypothetical protein
MQAGGEVLHCDVKIRIKLIGIGKNWNNSGQQQTYNVRIES